MCFFSLMNIHHLSISLSLPLVCLNSARRRDLVLAQLSGTATNNQMFVFSIPTGSCVITVLFLSTARTNLIQNAGGDAGFASRKSLKRQMGAAELLERGVLCFAGRCDCKNTVLLFFFLRCTRVTSVCLRTRPPLLTCLHGTLRS